MIFLEKNKVDNDFLSKLYLQLFQIHPSIYFIYYICILHNEMVTLKWEYAGGGGGLENWGDDILVNVEDGARPLSKLSQTSS